ncbi:MAG: branched-chain amino acid ABC transporter permease [Firmicutes bacterium]|nr:branched-chain amino acid ABC transporter permease [Bacillota bacterium]
MNTLILLILSGLTIGSIYGLVALGFTMIYTSTKVFNFAQGEFVMLGAVLAAVFIGSYHMPYPLAISLTLLLVILVGIVLQKLSVEVLQNKNASTIIVIMATLGASIIISNITRIGVSTRQMFVPPLLGNGVVQIGNIVLQKQNMLVIAAAVLALLLLWLFLNKTMVGLAVKAAGINRNAASLMGINLSRVITLTFIISACVGAVAGIVIAPIISAYSYMGLPFTVKGFIAAVLGGMGNPYAAAVGGLALGMIESLVAGYFSSSLTDIVTFILLPIILMIRPQGLFGEYEG